MKKLLVIIIILNAVSVFAQECYLIREIEDRGSTYCTYQCEDGTLTGKRTFEHCHATTTKY